MTEEQKIAFEHHKMFVSSSLENFKSVIAFSVEGLKSLQICHGGALTAVLAYYGTSKGNSVEIANSAFKAYWCFGGGLALTLLIWMLAYFAQYMYQHAASKIELTNEHPYFEPSKESKSWTKWGDIFRILGVFFALLSLILFPIGLMQLRGIFQ